MPVRVNNPDPVVESLDFPAAITHSCECDFRVGVKADINVDPAAGVRNPKMWLPQFNVERACSETHALARLASVDNFEAEVLVEHCRAVEISHFEHDFGDTNNTTIACTVTH